ncbi:MAG TPA: COG1361 S-layer family protein [Candidatus Nanoarchaeia archaeon]|nr:COG1361 S-layer family protein [Candidatus Nanoarchaeia archaeon]
MKKYVLLIVFVLAAGLALAAVNTQYTGKAPDLKISISIQDPDPVEPGKQVEVSFKIDNDGTTANSVIFEVLPEYPFSLVPEENAVKTIGTIGSSQNSRQNIIVRYKLKVAQDAVDGNYEVKVRYKSEGFDSWVSIEDLNVKVQSRDAIISVDRFITEPGVVAPGSKAKLIIVLKNHATSLLKDIKVVLDLGKSGDESTPFSPIGSTNEKVVAYIEPESTKSMEFELIADPDAVSKSYKIPISIKYSDTLGRNYSKSNILTIIVGGEPNVSVGIDSSTIYSAGAAGEITIKIVNKGLPDMKFVNVKLDKGDKYRIISPAEVYIGNIDSDDYETADFKLYVEKTSEKKIVLPLSLQYKDANNKDYKNIMNIELPLYSSSEAKKLGLVQGNGKVTWILLIVLAVAGFFGYRMWKKRRKH